MNEREDSPQKTIGTINIFQLMSIGVFFVLILAAIFFSAYYEINPKTHAFQRSIVGVFSGDEPHYLIVVNSILFDHDLDVRNNYRNIRYGGLDAGQRFKGDRLDHHTMIVNRETGQHVLWQSIFDYSKRKHCSQEKEDDECFNQVKPLDVVPEGAIEIGAHPPAFSGIIACAIKLFVDSPEQVERFAIVFNLLCSWLICVLVYLITSSIGLNKKYSLLATAVLVFASPWTIYSRSLFTENINGLFIMLAFWAVIEKRSLMAGILISIAMMIKPVFVVVGWGWICFFALDKDFRNALRLTITVGILGIEMLS